MKLKKAIWNSSKISILKASLYVTPQTADLDYYITARDVLAFTKIDYPNCILLYSKMSVHFQLYFFL